MMAKRHYRKMCVSWLRQVSKWMILTSKFKVLWQILKMTQLSRLGTDWMQIRLFRSNLDDDNSYFIEENVPEAGASVNDRNNGTYPGRYCGAENGQY